MSRDDGKLVHEYTATVSAGVAQVFAALTEPDQLKRWFAEFAEVEPRTGGAFRFWGRYTYGAPAAGTSNQRIAAFDPPRALSFRWDIEGIEGTVSIALSAKDAGDPAKPATTIAVRHVLASRPPIYAPEDALDDLWRFTLGNLAAQLRGGMGIVRPDFSDPHPHILMSILIDAPRERVFDALINPDAMRRWLGAPEPEVDARVGGRYAFGWKYTVNGREVVGGPTHILDIVPNERLVTNWPDYRGDPNKAETQVAWTLEAMSPAQTRVTLVHGGFTRTVDLSDYPFGWVEFAEALKEESERAT